MLRAACLLGQVVWQDLRQPLLEDVYRHSVQQARLGPVLELLDEALGSLCEATPKELHAGECSAFTSFCSVFHVHIVAYVYHTYMCMHI